MKFKTLFLFAVLSNCLFSQEVPNIIKSVNYKVETLSTDDGEFITWIVEDSEAKRIAKDIKRLKKVEVDRSNKDLIFTTYTDDTYEYVITKEKLFHRKARFYRISIYSI